MHRRAWRLCNVVDERVIFAVDGSWFVEMSDVDGSVQSRLDSSRVGQEVSVALNKLRAHM